MIYSNVKDGKTNGIVVGCNCGCSHLEVKISDGSVLVSAYDSSWYSRQDLLNTDGLRHMFRKLVKDDDDVFELIITRKDFNEFLKLAQSMNFDNAFAKEDDKCDCCCGDGCKCISKNDSHLSLEYLYFEGSTKELVDYAITIKSDLPIADVMKNKEFRCYEILYSRKEWEKLVDKMARYSAHVENLYFPETGETTGDQTKNDVQDETGVQADTE